MVAGRPLSLPLSDHALTGGRLLPYAHGVTRALTLGMLLLAGCASRTVIRSDPAGAQVMVDGSFVGVTPYTHEDRKLAFSSTSIRLAKPGYRDFVTTIRRDEQFNAAACVMGSCCLVPYLWIFGYKSERLYVLDPEGTEPASSSPVRRQLDWGEPSPEDWVQPGDPPL